MRKCKCGYSTEDDISMEIHLIAGNAFYHKEVL